MRNSMLKWCLSALLLLSAACPSDDENDQKNGLENDDEDAVARAGRGAAGKGGKGGLFGQTAGRVAEAAGSAAPREEELDESAGRSGGAAGAAGSAPDAAGRGGSGFAGRGASAGSSGRAGSPAAGSGGAGGTGSAVGGAGGTIGGAGQGGPPAAGSGGSVAGGTKLAAITTDAQAEAICNQLRLKLDPSDFDTIERGACTIEGLTGELQGLGACSELTQECLNAPVSAGPNVEEHCTAEDIPDCANVTVDEYLACTLASIASSSAFFAKLTCTTDIETLSEPATPAACVGPYQRCPEYGGSTNGGT